MWIIWRSRKIGAVQCQSPVPLNLGILCFGMASFDGAPGAGLDFPKVASSNLMFQYVSI